MAPQGRVAFIAFMTDRDCQEILFHVKCSYQFPKTMTELNPKTHPSTINALQSMRLYYMTVAKAIPGQWCPKAHTISSHDRYWTDSRPTQRDQTKDRMNGSLAMQDAYTTTRELNESVDGVDALEKVAQMHARAEKHTEEKIRLGGKKVVDTDELMLEEKPEMEGPVNILAASQNLVETLAHPDVDTKQNGTRSGKDELIDTDEPMRSIARSGAGANRQVPTEELGGANAEDLMIERGEKSSNHNVNGLSQTETPTVKELYKIHTAGRESVPLSTTTYFTLKTPTDVLAFHPVTLCSLQITSTISHSNIRCCRRPFTSLRTRQRLRSTCSAHEGGFGPV